MKKFKIYDEVEAVIEKIYQNKGKRYIELLLGLLLSAIVFNLILLPYNFVAGGLNGLAIIGEDFFNINPSLFILILSLIFLIISYIFLDVDKTKKTIIASLLYPLFVIVTAFIINKINIDITNLDFLTVSIISGVIMGVASGLILRNGFSSGGTSILTQIIHKYKNTSFGTGMLMSNGIIIILGAYLFGIEKAIYAIIILYISSVITDKVIIGISTNKCFYIITNKEKEIKNFTLGYLKNGATDIRIKGGFTDINKTMLMIIVPNKDYFIFKNAIEHIDEKVFYVVTDSYHVKGGKLKQKLEKL